MYVTILLSLACLSMIATVCVLIVHHNPGDRPDMPVWLRRLVFRVLARCVFAYDREMAHPSPATVAPIRLNSLATEMTIADKDDNDKDAKARGVDDEMRTQVKAIRTAMDSLLTLKFEKRASTLEVWRKAALIMDRFFLLVMGITTALVGLVCLSVLISNK